MDSRDRQKGSWGLRGREARRLLDWSVIGLAFPVAMILGFVAGRFIGGWFDAAKAGGAIGGLLGIAAGFYNVYKITVRLSREEADEEGDD